MIKRLFKTLVAVLAIAAAAAGPVRAQSHQKYTSGTVAVSALQEGDTLCAGVTINKDVTGTGVFAANRWKYGNPPVVKDGGAYFNVESCTILDGAAIAWSDGYATPVDENGNDGDAWIVTSKTGTDFVQLYLGGILLPAPPKYTVRMAAGTEDAANWSIASGNASVTGTQVLENVMSGSQVTATYNGTTKKVKSVKAVKYVPPTTPLDNTTTAWADGRYAVPAGGLTYSAAITVSGDVTLVLTDGETLTLNKGISLASGATLTVEGTGTMNVKGSNGNTSSTTGGSGTITLTSGTLTATGGNGQNGGDLETGAAGGAAINGSVIVDGGTLTATGGNGGNVGNDLWDGHGGAGGAAIGGSLTINAGTVTTTNGAAGSVGYDCDECSGGAAGKAVAGTVTDNR